MTRARIFLTTVVALIVVLGLGYAWGKAGRGAVETALDDTRQHLDLAEARGAILDARVSLYNNNFGEASKRLEDAKGPLRNVRARYQEAGQSGAASSVDAALAHVEEAQQLAGRLDPAANTRAGEALEALRVAASKS